MSEYYENTEEQNPMIQTKGQQYEEEPLVVDLSGFSHVDEEVVDLSMFQHISSGFFAQTKEPALSLNGKNVTVNTAAVRLFPDVEYMEILISKELKRVVFIPCNELNIHGYKWAKEKGGKRYATHRTGLPFVLTVCQIMGWDFEKRHRILGKKVRSNANEEVLLFDLNAVQSFAKPNAGEAGKKNRSTILTGWDGTFGPKYNESNGTLHIDTFDGYTVFSIKEGWVQDNKDQEQNNKEQVNDSQNEPAQNNAEDKK